MNTTLTLKLQGLKDEIITSIKNSRLAGGVAYTSLSEVLSDLREAYVDDDFLQCSDLIQLENDIINNYPEVLREIEKVSNIDLEEFIDSFTEFDLRNYHINAIANRFNQKFPIVEFEFEMDDSGYSPEVYFRFEIETWTGTRRFLISQSGTNGVYSTSITEVEPR